MSLSEDATDLWTQTIQPQMKKIVFYALQSVQDEVSLSHKKNHKKNTQKKQTMHE